MGLDEIVRNTDKPNTVSSLSEDYKKIGIKPGMVLIVHSSLSSIGWVCGAEVAVILALENLIRPYGTLVMPCHSGDLSDPSGWENPPVPEAWWEIIRKSMPAFNPEFTPSSGMGTIPECFRKQSDVLRSIHPHVSFAAWGEKSLYIVENHQAHFGLGESSPLGKLYELDAYILLLGVGYDSNTSFHLAEYKADYPKKHYSQYSAPLMIDGHRRWKTFKDLDYSSDDFSELGRNFEKDNKNSISHGYIGMAKSLLFSQRLCVDYATHWFERHRL